MIGLAAGVFLLSLQVSPRTLPTLPPLGVTTLVVGRDLVEGLPTDGDLDGILAAKVRGQWVTLKSGFVAHRESQDVFIAFSPNVREIRELRLAADALDGIANLPSGPVHRLSEFGPGLRALIASKVTNGFPLHAPVGELPASTAVFIRPGNRVVLAGDSKSVPFDMDADTFRDMSKEDVKKAYDLVQATELKMKPPGKASDDAIRQDIENFVRKGGAYGIDLRVYSRGMRAESNVSLYGKAADSLLDYLKQLEAEVQKKFLMVERQVRARYPEMFSESEIGLELSKFPAAMRTRIRDNLIGSERAYGFATPGDAENFLSTARVVSQKVSLTVVISLEPDQLMRFRIWPPR